MSGASKKKKVKKPSKGVRVTIKDNVVLVHIHIIVSFGKSITEIAHHIQNEAKALLEREFPEYALSAVNIWVDGVRFDDASVAYRSEAIQSLSDATSGA